MRITVAIALLISTVYASQTATERSMYAKKGNLWLTPNESQHRLVAKFHPDVRARAGSDGSVSFLRAEMPAALDTIIIKYNLSFSPYIKLSEQKLDAIEARAKVGADKRNTGYYHLGFAGILEVHVNNPTNERLLGIAQELEKLDEVLYCELESTTPVKPPFDIPPVTPDYTADQTYFEPNPGVDINYAWSLGAKGKGVSVADVEYAWTDGHEEWNDKKFIRLTEYHPSVPNQWLTDGHGAAVAGMIFGGDNGYGVTGMACETEAFYAFPQWAVEYNGVNHASAMLDAVAVLEEGDILLLEFQLTGPLGTLVPGEYNKVNWDATRAATDAGIIVVATGSNGDTDMDNPAHDSWKNYGHSGAIMVGAGSANEQHDKLGFSTYGSRFDVQGWGESITSCGWYGWMIGDDFNQQYTNSFGGTSGAGPMVVGVVACIQSYAKNTLGYTMPAQEMRDLLVSTGIAQGSGGHIGLLPNTKAALEKLISQHPLGLAYTNITNDNNSDGKIDPGETADINVTVINNSSSPASVTAAISESSDYITVNTGSVDLGAVNGGSSKVASFSVTASSGTPLETEVEFTFTATSSIDNVESKKKLLIGMIPRVDFSKKKLMEADANNGSIEGHLTLILYEDKFTVNNGPMTQGTHFTVSNLPSGLIPYLIAKDDTSAIFTISGLAGSHGDNNDVDNLTLTFLDAALMYNDASGLSNTSTTLSLDFIDPYVIAYEDFTDKVTNSSSTWNHFYVKDSKGNSASSCGGFYLNGNLKLETYTQPLMCEDSTRNITCLSENTVIGPKSNWIKGGTYEEIHDIWTSSYTAWQGKEGYVGMRFENRFKTFYGWIRASVNVGGSSYTIYSYAFSETPGGSIKAGQKNFQNESPIAGFSANITEIDKGQQVHFTDRSLNNPTTWSWTFEGGTPSSSTSQNPIVTYNSNGIFSVSLQSTNANGSDAKTVDKYIYVGTPVPIIHEITITKNRQPGLIAAPNPAIRQDKQVHFYFNSPGQLYAELRIFDVVGNVVFTKKCTINPNRTKNRDNSFASWNFTNNYGRRVAPGSYMVILKTRNSKNGEVNVSKRMIGIIQ